MSQPEGPEEFYARVAAATDDEGRLPVAIEEMPGWDIYPFEVDSLRIKPLQPLADEEPDRGGESADDCWCSAAGDHRADPQVLWSDGGWRLKATETGLPAMLILEPLAHHDLLDLPTDRVAGLGPLMIAVVAAVESLPSVGRCHVQRIGDGTAHLHLWFLGRPARSPQFRGSPLLDWEENFPRVPLDVRRVNAAAVAAHLVAAIGGEPGPFVS